MRFILITVLFLTMTLFVIFSCKKQPDISNIPDICFNTQVLPIFQTNCAISGCHNSNFERGIRLTDYENIIKNSRRLLMLF